MYWLGILLKFSLLLLAEESLRELLYYPIWQQCLQMIKFQLL